jgi:hypothetical protein
MPFFESPTQAREVTDRATDYAWSRLRAQLEASAEVGSIVAILLKVERAQQGLPACQLEDLSLKHALRLKRIAEACLARLDPELEEQAVDEAAHVICEGIDAEYARFEDQTPRLQAHYRRHAQSTINAYHDRLTGLRTGECR